MDYEFPRVSIVICTDGRADALAETLYCLRYLEGGPFEVCVVRGPTEDGIGAVLDRWCGQIKIAVNPERNLSVSRNLGITLASGEFVAFIDDDGMPEPEWLEQVVRAFDDPRVGAAGGIVMDHTGARPQYLYASADRLANADWQRVIPAEEYNFPGSFNIPYVQGTNSIFRRAALLDVGGFDEEYEFYLDETDLCCRMVDRGWLIRQLPSAVVHHKFLPSAIRNADRITRVLYPVLKNKLYFSLVNNLGHYALSVAIDSMQRFVETRRQDLDFHIEGGRLPRSDIDLFLHDVDQAWDVGLRRGLSGERRLMKKAAPEPPPMLPFPVLHPAGPRETCVFLSQEYPPARIGGIGRCVSQLARGVARLGHQVHVLTVGEDHDRIDFEEGVWVHRLVVHPVKTLPPVPIPSHIWALATRMREGVENIANRRPVTAVHAPIWDCEGIAVLLEGRFPLVTGLHTMLRSWLDSQPERASDLEFQRAFVQPMLALEKKVLGDSTKIHANSAAILDEIRIKYEISLDPDRVQVIHHGLDDWLSLPATPPDPIEAGGQRLLFVGRLEPRKGADVLLAILPNILRTHPRIFVDLVGNHQIKLPSGLTERQHFLANCPAELQARVRFHGEIADEALRGLYQACDIVLVPSRFESFGLVLLEAMMFGKPVIASRSGGLAEIAAHGETALLVEPDDPAALENAITSLAQDPALMQRLGAAARAHYLANFTTEIMASRVVELLRLARDVHTNNKTAA